MGIVYLVQVDYLYLICINYFGLNKVEYLKNNQICCFQMFDFLFEFLYMYLILWDYILVYLNRLFLFGIDVI